MTTPDDTPRDGSGNGANGGASDEQDPLRGLIVAALKTCYDPEIPVDIWELGLIYDIAIAAAGEAVAATEDGLPDASDGPTVTVKMTLTSPACPVAGTLPLDVEQKVRAVEGVADARVELVWEPQWTPERMSDVAKLKLNMF